MSSRYRPLKYREVATILANLGFTRRPTKATGHEQWAKVLPGKLLKVTVSKSKREFGHDLIRYMAHQAGVTKKQFYEALGS